MIRDRRQFLQSAAAAGAFLVGCSDDDAETNGPGTGGSGTGGSGTGGSGAGGSGGSGSGACVDPFEGGELLGQAEFVDADGNDEATIPLETLMNQGWDGRLYTDLSLVGPEQLVTPVDSFYVRTRYPDLLNPPDPWTIAVSGLVTPTTLDLPDLMSLAEDMGPIVLECSGNGAGGGFGLLSAAEWKGIPMAAVLDQLDVSGAATRVLVSGFDEHSTPSVGGHSTPGASWIFTFDELDRFGAFLATEMNGAPLTPDHGQPVRLLVPGWYGCSCIKWVNEIVLVDDSEAATSQMQEFASRTHQSGVPALAKDYISASMDQAAMPVRIEKWRVDGQIVYRVSGILWGGYELTDALSVRFRLDEMGGEFAPVDVCPAQTTNRTWTLWQHVWRPEAVGDYRIRCRIDDANIPTRRLDTGYYDRYVRITEV